MADNVIPLRPGSLRALTDEADASATVLTRDARLKRRVGEIDEATKARPKMSPTDREAVAGNLDRMLLDYKPRVSLGDLCRKVNLGDGRDPKPLYNYRLPSKNDIPRKLIGNARKYWRIVQELAALAGEDETRLLGDLFRGTSYHEDDAAGSNAALDLVELLEGMTLWISRTTRLATAFAAAKTARAVVRTGADGGRYCALDWFAELGPTGRPDIPLFFRDEALDVKSLPGLQAVTSGGTPALLCERESVSLALSPNDRGLPRAVLDMRTDCGALIGHTYSAVDTWTATRESICLTLEDGCQLSLRFQGLAEEWDRLEATGEDPEDNIQFSFDPLDYLYFNWGKERSANSQGLESIAQWAGRSEFGTSSFIMQWSDFTVAHGRGQLQRLLNGFDGQQVRHPEYEWAIDARLARTMARRSPESGWAVAAPTAMACSLPDLMWLLADEYAELVLGEIAFRRSREDQARLGVLRRMRGED